MTLLGDKKFDLTVGRTYALKNRMTLETARFTIKAMIEYAGGAVLYGVAGRHGITPVQGVSKAAVPERESCPVFFPGAPAVEVERFCQVIGGPLIGLVFTDQVSIINIMQTVVPPTERYYPIAAAPLPCWYFPDIKLAYLTGLPRPAPGQRRVMLKLGMKTIDLWNGWRAAGHALPEWAVIAKRQDEFKKSLQV